MSYRAMLALMLLGFAATAARPAAAQDFSGKPIRIIVGLAPGGATDVTARLIAQRLTASLNTNVYVENKPGGAFEPAYHELTSAAPDGHTLFMISAAVTVTQPAQKDYPYDIRTMTPVTEVSEGPFILVGRKALNFRTVTDLVDYGKKNPGKLTFGSGGGTGSSLSLAAELLRISAGISIVNVPYKGAAEALNDLLGGRVDAMFDAMPVQVAQVKAGNVSGLAVTSAQRAAALPDVPTMAESGFKDYVVSNYFGLLAPPGTPPAVAQKLRDEVAKIVAAPDVAALFGKQGMKPVADEPAQFGQVLSADLARWTDVIKKAGIVVQ
ncbi:MAG TPA: tripartite tricarboxylate transporter substrate binding protein, partial [Xanthobacteraceae bacterium]|nr:tripartite tricarboxylate transporter substrate binding protein [Xanthobacteraceae bacterium]